MSNSLSTVEAKLPPGFRFHPRDDELICDYLMKWMTSAGCIGQYQFPLLIEVDLNKCEPWDIPETACVGSKEWYFYSQRDRKYATGLRTNRATESGYWKATGKDRSIFRKGNLVGMRKTLVFYQGRAPKGKKTEWVMHEFRLEGTLGPDPKVISSKEDWVLCRVFYKSRSEVNPSSIKLETESVVDEQNVIAYESSSPSLPPLIEPSYNNNITFDHQTQAIINDQYHEQVPCFSIFTSNQTNPSFSLVTPQDTLPTKTMPNFGGSVFDPILGINYNSILSPTLYNNHNPSTSDDKKVIKDVLNQYLTTSANANMVSMDGSPPSFGEGSTDSYLSEVVSSIWNQYS